MSLRMNGARRVVVLALTTLSIILPDCASADPLSDLGRSFREAYAEASARKLVELREEVPLLVNRFGQIAFYRPGRTTPEVYSMDMRLYLEARSVAHAPVAVIARLSSEGFGPLDAATIEWLGKFEISLAEAEADLLARPGLSPNERREQRELLATVRRHIKELTQRGQVDRRLLNKFALAVRAGIRSNLKLAAASQLDQFRTQLETWKAEYPELPWKRAVVVILGVHQARDEYLQRQFFDWLLNDDPERQNRVIFAETLESPPPLDKMPATRALELLSKVMLDKVISESLFQDPLALQSDVLGHEAKKIISRWPRH